MTQCIIMRVIVSNISWNPFFTIQMKFIWIVGKRFVYIFTSLSSPSMSILQTYNVNIYWSVCTCGLDTCTVAQLTGHYTSTEGSDSVEVWICLSQQAVYDCLFNKLPRLHKYDYLFSLQIVLPQWKIITVLINIYCLHSLAYWMI